MKVKHKQEYFPGVTMCRFQRRWPETRQKRRYKVVVVQRLLSEPMETLKTGRVAKVWREEIYPYNVNFQ